MRTLIEELINIVLAILATILGFIPLEAYAIGWIYYTPATFWQYFAYIIMGIILSVIQLVIYYAWYLPYVSSKDYFY